MAITKGDRVRLVHTDDLYTLLKPGDEGVVVAVVNDWNPSYLEYWMRWDNGSTLGMIPSSGDVIVPA